MIKRILILGLFACSFLFANAAAQYMTIEQKDGKKYSFLLHDNPVITYSGGNLVVNGSATTSYAISGVKNFHFTEGNETGVKNQLADVLRIVNLDGNTLQIQNAQASEKVILFNVMGHVVFSATTDVDGSVIVNLPGQKGTYVLTVGLRSIKIIRK
ncbi:MAG: hypothetical protein IJJ77_00885 [Paludibacteraceae bacterium]|nr:hypothetical protein [Paludibacteraceae bacterium]